MIFYAPFSRGSPPSPSRATRPASPITGCGEICSAFSARASSVCSITGPCSIHAANPRLQYVYRSMCSTRSSGSPSRTPSRPGNSRGLSRPAMRYPSIIAGSDGSSSSTKLSPEVLRLHYQTTQQAALPPFPAGQQLDLALEPTTRAQRLLQAIGPDHLLLRFRTYREYPTEEQARWRIIELLEVGFRPRRVAKLLGIQVAVVYQWQRRFHTWGLVGLTTQTRTDTPITMRVSVQAMMDVFQLLDNNPLLGHYRVKMALDSLGYRYGHTTVWQMVALYKQAHPGPPRQPRVPNPAERPRAATAPHQVWFVDLRYLVQIAGHWLYSVLIFDGYSRAIVGAGCCERQNFSRIVQVFRQALTQWGAPEQTPP